MAQLLVRNLNPIVIVFLLLFSSPVPCDQHNEPAASEKTFIFSGTLDTQNTRHGVWLKLIYQEVLARLGYQFSYQGYPTKRATTLVEQGKVDGEITRAFQYKEQFPSLVRVEEPHFSANIVAYSYWPNLELTGWKSFEGVDLRVVYRLGIKRTEIWLPRLIPKENLSYTINVERALTLLSHNRVDVYVDVEDTVDGTLRYFQASLSNRIYKAGVMESVSTHAYLHPRHKNLAPLMSDTLRAMKKEGLIEQYRAIAFSD